MKLQERAEHYSTELQPLGYLKTLKKVGDFKSSNFITEKSTALKKAAQGNLEENLEHNSLPIVAIVWKNPSFSPPQTSLLPRNKRPFSPTLTFNPITGPVKPTK